MHMGINSNVTYWNLLLYIIIIIIIIIYSNILESAIVQYYCNYCIHINKMNYKIIVVYLLIVVLDSSQHCDLVSEPFRKSSCTAS